MPPAKVDTNGKNARTSLARRTCREFPANYLQIHQWQSIVPVSELMANIALVGNYDDGLSSITIEAG